MSKCACSIALLMADKATYFPWSKRGGYLFCNRHLVWVPITLEPV